MSFPAPFNSQRSIYDTRGVSAPPEHTEPASRALDQHFRQLSASVNVELLPSIVKIDSNTPSPQAPGAPTFAQWDLNSVKATSDRVSNRHEESVLPSIESPEKPNIRNSCPDRSHPSSQIEAIRDSSTSPPQRATSANMSNEIPVSTSSLPAELQSQAQVGNSRSPSLTEKLRNIRAVSRANFAARQANLAASTTANGSKSPSLIPEPKPIEDVGDSRLDITTVDIPLPQPAYQTDTEVSHDKKFPATQNGAISPQIIRELETPNPGEMEFFVSLPLPTRVKDIYVKTIEEDQDIVKKFLETDMEDDTLVEQIEILLARVNNISSHIDLNDETTMTQQEAAPECHAVWAANCNGKFQFLYRLMDLLRGSDLHIVIVAKGGRLLDIIELFLKGNHFNYSRPDTFSQSNRKEANGRLEVTLMASGEQESSALVKFANLVVAFDSSFSSEEAQIKSLRQHMLNVGKLSPVVHLLIYSSVEHIARCIPSSFTGINRLKVLMNCVARTSHLAGELAIDEGSPEEAAGEVSHFIQGALHPDHWTLPHPRNIQVDGLELVDQSQSDETPNQEDAEDVKDSTSMVIDGRKRPLVSSAIESNAERPADTISRPKKVQSA